MGETRTITVVAPKGFSAEVVAEEGRLNLKVHYNNYEIKCHRESITTGGETFVIEAPLAVDATVESHPCSLKINIKVVPSLFRMYHRDNVMSFIEKFEQRNPFLNNSEISGIKIQELGENYAVIWALTSDSRILKETVEFSKLADLTIEEDARLGFMYRYNCVEIMSDETPVARKCKFEELTDAWLAKEEN